MSNTDTNVADNVLYNDAFAVYAEIDVAALQEAAIQQSKASDSAGRKETQMQVANILARYAQDRLIADASPSKLYTVELHNGAHNFNVGTAKLITRTVYDVPEKDEDGKKVPLPQHLLARIRRISPLVFYCVQHRIALIWCDKRKALGIPRWMAIADEALSEAFWNTPERRTGYQDLVYLDGKVGRTLDSVVKRVEKSQKPVNRGTNSEQAETEITRKSAALKTSMSNNGLEKTLELLSEMFASAPEKPFSDPIVELLALCCEHINARNGVEALGKAVADMSPKKQAKRQAA